MRDNISPEEKLLRLIRGQKKQAVVTDKISAINPQEAKLSKSRLFNFPLQKVLFFLTINRIIFTVLIASCAYLIFTFVYPVFLPDDFNLPKVSQARISQEKTALIPQIKPFEFYAEGFKSRQLFSSQPEGNSEQSPSQINSDLLKDLSLIGVISGDNPQAVIEDKKLQKTYYVTKGQLIGQFKLEEILDGKIILNYNGQKFELYL